MKEKEIEELKDKGYSDRDIYYLTRFFKEKHEKTLKQLEGNLLKRIDSEFLCSLKSKIINIVEEEFKKVRRGK